MIILYGLTSAGLMGQNPVGQTSSYQNPLIVPSGYAFAIWSIIYLGIIVFPFYQWLYRKQGLVLWSKLHLWYSGNVLANGMWLVAASYDWLWLSLVIIVFMLISLIKINDTLIELDKQKANINFWCERAVFSIYFAWITLATALNVSAALSFYQWDGFGISQEIWSLIILPIVALIAGLVFRKYRDAFYAGVVVWAFVALVVRHYDTGSSIAILSGVIALVFLGLIFFKRQPILKQRL